MEWTANKTPKDNERITRARCETIKIIAELKKLVGEMKTSLV